MSFTSPFYKEKFDELEIRVKLQFSKIAFNEKIVDALKQYVFNCFSSNSVMRRSDKKVYFVHNGKLHGVMS